jgi:hypothetical protein
MIRSDLLVFNRFFDIPQQLLDINKNFVCHLRALGMLFRWVYDDERTFGVSMVVYISENETAEVQ